MARTYKLHKPLKVMSQRLALQRWTGKAWDDSLCSPYKTMAEIRAHLKEYHWHYTAEHPYRVVDYKPKKVQKYVPKYKNWNSDEGMVVKI
jgi:hypothetical protein